MLSCSDILTPAPGTKSGGVPVELWGLERGRMESTVPCGQTALATGLAIRTRPSLICSANCIMGNAFLA